MTPPDPKRFMNRDGLIAIQAHNAIDERARVATPINTTLGSEVEDKACGYSELVEEVRRLKKRDAENEHKIIGLRNLRASFIEDYWNPSCIAVETEVGYHKLSELNANWFVGGGFRDWSGGTTTPNAVTISLGAGATGARVAARTGAEDENFGYEIANGANASTFSEAGPLLKWQPGRAFALAFWAKITTGSFTVNVTSTGAATNINQTTPAFSATDMGAAGWFALPTVKVQGATLLFDIPSDATGLTLTFTVAANSTVAFSDIQCGPGVERHPDLWTPAPEDSKYSTPTNSTVPVGRGSSGQVRTTDGAGAESWSTPATAPSAETYTPTGTAVNNVTTITPGVAYYTKIVGTITLIHVWGTFSVDPVAAGATQFRLSLPVASNFSAVTDASGGCVHGPVAGLCGGIDAVIATDDLLAGFISPDGTQRTFQWWADYVVRA